VISSNLVAQLNESWRIVLAHDGKQWVLARLDDRWGWIARSHCRTRPALERCVQAYAGAVDPAALAILAGLPWHIDWGAANAATVADSGVRRGARRRKSPEEVLAR
jgi:hypothetical protein